MKTFYSDYIAHCLRFYARHQKVDRFRSSADQQNWLACESVIRKLSPKEREIVLTIFDNNARDIAVAVNKQAKDHHIGAGKLWKQIYDIEKRIAKRRGLI